MIFASVVLALQALTFVLIYLSVRFMNDSDVFWPVVGLANVCSLALVVIVGMYEDEVSEDLNVEETQQEAQL